MESILTDEELEERMVDEFIAAWNRNYGGLGGKMSCERIEREEAHAKHQEHGAGTMERELEAMFEAAEQEQAERDAWLAAQGFGTDSGPGDCDNGEIPDYGRPPRPWWYGR